MTINARAIIVLLATGCFAGPALAEDQPFSKWFRYGLDIDATWKVAGDPNSPMQVSIRRKDASQREPAKRVLVLYPRPSSAYDIAITKILRIFDAKEIDAEFTIVNFEIKDAPGNEAIRRAEQSKSNLIFAMGSESTAWAYDHYRGGMLPVVSVCSKDPVQLGQMKDYDSGSGSNFAFTSLNVPIEIQMAYIRELKPDLKTIAVLVDSKNLSAVQTQAEPIAAAARQNGIQTIMGTVQNPAKAKEELTAIVPRSVETMRKSDPDLQRSIFLITGSTAVFKEIHTINEHAGRVPVISMIPDIVSSGSDTAVLAVGVSFESNAEMAAIYGADIVRGRAKPADLKVGLVSPPDIAISFLKAREIGLRVPFGFFETATFVYDYQGRPVRAAAHPIQFKN